MKVLFFGKLRDPFGPEIELRVEAACTVAEVRRQLVALQPAAAEALSNRRVRACVGSTLVDEDYKLAPDGEVEFLAPVSGG